jgi:hypothetical protein
MTHKAVPYPEMLSQVGERIAKRSKDEFVQAQTILYRKEEQEKGTGVRNKETGETNARVLAGTPRKD